MRMLQDVSDIVRADLYLYLLEQEEPEKLANAEWLRKELVAGEESGSTLYEISSTTSLARLG